MEKTFVKDILARNCFFLWSQGVVLLLSSISVFSWLASLLFNVPEWVVPKTYELKIYAVCMFMCVAVVYLARWKSALFQLDYPRYRLYFLLFYPLMVIIYSYGISDLFHYNSVFLFSLLGVAILFYDLTHVISIKPSFLNRHYDKLLIASVAFSTFLIIYKSKANLFNPFSVSALMLFIAVFLILRFAATRNKYLIYLMPVFIFLLTFGAMQSAMEVTHYSFFLEPVIEVLYGRNHPLAIDIQYGGGLTAFLALYFKLIGFVSFAGMLTLLKFLAFIQYLLIYFIAFSLYRSQKIAFLTLLAILMFNFFAPNINCYYCPPSFGFLRFGFIYLIVGCYALENKLFSPRAVVLLISILGSIASLWSFESAIYTLPALFFAEYMNGNLRKFLPTFAVCSLMIGFGYLAPFFLRGEWPPLFRYYEYASVYANGFGQIPINRATSFWWLFPLLYGFFLIKIMTGSIRDKRISALTIYGIAIFTYFVGRAHPINLLVVSIPFILLSIYLILNLNSPSLLAKQLLITAILIVYPTSYYVLDSQRMVFQGVWQDNLPLVKSFLTKRSAPFLLSDSGAPWLNRLSAHLAETPCSSFVTLQKYIENHSIAIISTDDKNLLALYACTKTHNAFGFNPYYAIALNPKAMTRVIEKAKTLKNHYILVESNLLESKDEFWNGQTAKRILQSLNAKRVETIKLEGESIDIFKS